MTDLKLIEKQVSPVIKEASALNITSTKELTNASTLRENIKKLQKAIEDDKEKLYRPMKDAIDELNSRYDVYLKPLKEALKIANDKMTAYQTAAMKKQREEEAKIAARIGEGKGKLKVETALNKMSAVEKPAELDNTGFVNRPIVWITNAGLIPRHFLTPDFKAIEIALKAGNEVPGCELRDNLVPRSK